MIPRELRKAAASDMVKGLLSWRIWVKLAWNDIRLRYARSVLGPIWLAISTGIWAFGLGFVFSTLWGMELHDFLPHVTTGVVAWTFISGILAQAPVSLIMYKNVITSIGIPISIQVYRFVMVQVITFMHNLPVAIIVLVIFWEGFGWSAFLMIPGLILVIVNATWVTLFLGLLGARFRDLQQLVANLITILFFLTPIVWQRETLGSRTYIADVNPFFHLLEVIRAPLLGQPFPIRSTLLILLMAVVGWIITYFSYSRFRSRIYYWL